MHLSPDSTAVILSHPGCALALWKQADAISALLTYPHPSAAHLSPHGGKDTGTACPLHCVATCLHWQMSNAKFKHKGKGSLLVPASIPACSQEKYLCLLQPKALLYDSGDQLTLYFSIVAI